ncbi:MAG: ABC transporter, permease protein (cluster 3, basic aa/glutamine/opines), partial [uncultured Craurococcus sp.]
VPDHHRPAFAARPAPAAAAALLVRRTGSRHRLADPRRRPARRHPLVALVEHRPQPRGAAHRHRLRLPQPRGGAADRREPHPLQPDRYLFPRPAHRLPQHAEGCRRRHRAGHDLRHVDRHRAPVEELAALQDRRRLHRGDPRPAAAAAAALLVRDPPGPARAAPGAEPGGRRLPLQPRAQAALDRVAGRAFLCAAGLRARRRLHLVLPARRHRQAHPRRQAAAGLADGAGLPRGAAARRLGRRRRAVDGRLAGAARLQLPRRPQHVARVFRPAAGADHVHGGLHRRDRARRHPRRAAWPVGGGAGARPPLRPGAEAGGAAPGAARHHPADDQPVPQHHQEQLAGGGDRLPGHRLDRQHDAEPDRPGDRGHRHHHAGLSEHQPVDQPVHELVQRAHRAGGKV